MYACCGAAGKSRHSLSVGYPLSTVLRAFHTHKDDKSLPIRDHLAQSRPLCQRQRATGGQRIALDPTALEDRVEGASRQALGVGKQQGHHLIRIAVKERLEGAQIRLQGPSILQGTKRVAQVDRVVQQVRLRLEEAHALRKLVGDRRFLVVGEVGAHECRVVGANEGDVAVCLAAEGLEAVAHCGGGDIDEDRRGAYRF